jgi:adenylate cyclase
MLSGMHTVNLPDHRRLRELLEERAQYPDREAVVDAAIRAEFERVVAVLCLDMSGFSRLTARRGVVFYLAMIHQMHAAALPAVTANAGVVVKTVADNLFALFPSVRRAVDAALDIQRAFAAVNAAVPSERDIHGCIGIGYGPLLVLDEVDCFGAEMNLACKLGEDHAERDEILLTPAAAAELQGTDYRLESEDFGSAVGLGYLLAQRPPVR